MVTQYEAAKLAGVSRSAISQQSKKKLRPRYFVYNSLGKLAINEEDPMFIAYCEKIERDKIKAATRETKMDRLARCTVEVLDEELGLDLKTRNELLKKIDEKYNAV